MNPSRRALVGWAGLLGVSGLAGCREGPGESGLGARAAPFQVPPLPPAEARAAAADLPRASDNPLHLRVGPARAVKTLAQAARVAPDGAVVDIDPGDYLGDVAVWEQQALTLRGAGPGVRLIADGRSAEGKAIWVMRHGRFDVEHIEFIGARVPDRNGAGIRLEGGTLQVRHCRFFDNESGILTNAGADMRLDVAHSEFSHHGAGDGLSHALYVGDIGHFRLSGSYLHHANVGHLVKSRARHNRIEYNRLSDEAGGRASYELEFPNGGHAEVVGNLLQQGPDTRNPVMLSFGAEGYRGPENRLLLGSNSFVNDLPRGGTLVWVAPGAVRVVSANNLHLGPGGRTLPGGALVFNDVRADRAQLAQPDLLDGHLRSNDPVYAYRPPAGPGWTAADMAALQVQARYLHPRATQRLALGPRVVGADQRAAR